MVDSGPRLKKHSDRSLLFFFRQGRIIIDAELPDSRVQIELATGQIYSVKHAQDTLPHRTDHDLHRRVAPLHNDPAAIRNHEIGRRKSVEEFPGFLQPCD